MAYPVHGTERYVKICAASVSQNNRTYDIGSYRAIQIPTRLDVYWLRNIAQQIGRSIFTMKLPWLERHRVCTTLLRCLRTNSYNGDFIITGGRNKIACMFPAHNFQYTNHTGSVKMIVWLRSTDDRKRRTAVVVNQIL